MALTYSKQLLGGSTSGHLIEINNTTSPGTTVHTVVSTGTDNFEEVYSYCVNGATADATLTLEWGGTGTEDQILFTVPPEDGLYLITPGTPLTATTSIVRAFATATGVLRVAGWVNRAT